MYLEIDRKWLEKNMDKLEKKYEEQSGEKGKILITTEGLADVEDWMDDMTVLVCEGNDNISCYLEVQIDLDLIKEALEYWWEKLKQIKELLGD